VATPLKSHPVNHAYKEFALPGARPQYMPDKPGNVEHIALIVTINLEAKSLTGTCRIRLRVIDGGVRTLRLDAVEMQVSAVSVDGAQIAFVHDGKQLTLELSQVPEAGQVLEIAIQYHVEKPRRGIYFTGPTAEYPNKPIQVWTQGEDEDSRFWFPCFDYPGQLATSEIIATVPDGYQTVSNGILTNIEPANATKTFHWRQAKVHPCYLITLVVAQLSEIQDHWEDIATPYYVTPGREEEAKRSMGKTPRMVAFFSEKFGVRYPFAQYAQVVVQDFIFGGMENTSATTLTDRCLLSESAAKEVRWPEDLVSHELVHQWFGDLVVIKHWSHAWLKEGAATYSETLWRAHEFGVEDAAYFFYGTAKAYLEEDSSRYRRAIVTNIYKEPIELYDRHLYEKGACVYHMLHHYLGDAAFFRTLKTFLTDNAHNTVETIDLLRAIEKATGRNMLPLFEQYVFKGGHPDFQVTYAWDSETSLAKVIVKQTQTVDDLTVLFNLNIGLAFGFTGAPEPKIFTIRFHEKEQTICFPFAEKPLYFSFDPGNHVLKTLELEVPVENLKNQLLHDPDLIGRILATKALAKQLTPPLVSDLQAILRDENIFWGLRVEIAQALGNSKKDYAFQALRESAGASDPQVRSAVAQALTEDRTAETFDCLKQLLDDESDFVTADAARALGKSRQGEAFDLLAPRLESRDSWNETVRGAIVSALANIKEDPRTVDLILAKTERGTVQSLRLAAIRALGVAGEGGENQKVLDAIVAIAQETQFSIRMATISALESLKSTKALPLLGQIATDDPDGRVQRSALEASERLRNSIAQDKEFKTLRESVEALQTENRSLKSRLEVLETSMRKE
jgi:aminopeptidase N